MPNREVIFSMNIVQFLNGKVSNVKAQINGTPVGYGYVDIDVDISITHPFSGAPAFNGYDVRGIFIGNGSKSLNYNIKLRYAARDLGSYVDQQMYDYNLTTADPHPGKVGNPDGYTRWWNPTEFTTPGLFGYTPGKISKPGYSGTALLNPYKYFADGLGVSDPLWPYLRSKRRFKPYFHRGRPTLATTTCDFPIPLPGSNSTMR